MVEPRSEREVERGCPTGGPGRLPDILRKQQPAILTVLLAVWIAAQVAMAATAFRMDYDEGVYLQTALQQARGDRLYGELFLSQPPLLIECLSILIRLLGPQVVVGRLFILACTLLLMAGIYLSSRALFGRAAARLSLYLALICYPFFKQAVVIYADIPSVSCATFAIYFAIRFNQDRKMPWLVASALAFSAAAGFKVLAPFYALPISFLMVFRLSEGGKLELHGRSILPILSRHALYALIVIATTFILYSAYPMKALLEQVWGMGSSGILQAAGGGAGPNDFLKIIGNWAIRNLIPALLAVYLIGRSFHTRKGVSSFLLVWICAQVAFFALMNRWLWEHHLVAILPPVIIGAAGGAFLVIHSRRRYTGEPARVQMKRSCAEGWICAAVVLLLIIPYGYADLRRFAEMTSYRTWKEEWAALPIIRQNSGPEDRILTDNPIMIFRSNRLTYPDLVDVSGKRIKTGHLTERSLTNLGNDPELIISWTNRLRSFKEWHAAIEKDYRVLYQKEDRLILVRTGL